MSGPGTLPTDIGYDFIVDDRYNPVRGTRGGQ
jgi:hypothetical protein